MSIYNRENQYINLLAQNQSKRMAFISKIMLDAYTVEFHPLR